MRQVFIRLGGMSFAVSMLMALSASDAGAVNQWVVAAYLNGSYCHGAAEVYAERLAGTSHSSGVRDARHIGNLLKRYVERMASRHKFKTSRSKAAKIRGRKVMSRQLPAKGGWRNGGEIPAVAFQQYQQCVSIVRQ